MGGIFVKELFDELNSNLTNQSNEKFYFDIQNGIRGYNTSAARGADTFHPFKSGITYEDISYGAGTNTVNFDNKPIMLFLYAISGAGEVNRSSFYDNINNDIIGYYYGVKITKVTDTSFTVYVPLNYTANLRVYY